MQGLVADVVWGGSMAFAPHEMPMIGRKGHTGLWHATAFGGHGVCMCTVAGELISDAIANKGTGWHTWQQASGEPSYAGYPFGPLAVQCVEWGYRLYDRWKIMRAGAASAAAAAADASVSSDA